ncbi:hypothetical protein ANO11243_014740 [Dothideomycetidae sp. 11243]|nr:hypothetical protein ANO11243_014740 [fungal sp. No.11243]
MDGEMEGRSKATAAHQLPQPCQRADVRVSVLQAGKSSNELTGESSSQQPTQCSPVRPPEPPLERPSREFWWLFGEYPGHLGPRSGRSATIHTGPRIRLELSYAAAPPNRPVSHKKHLHHHPPRMFAGRRRQPGCAAAIQKEQCRPQPSSSIEAFQDCLQPAEGGPAAGVERGLALSSRFRTLVEKQAAPHHGASKCHCRRPRPSSLVIQNH